MLRLALVVSSILTLAVSGCSGGGSDAEPYAFFVAGHVYGAPKLQGLRPPIHPPFAERLPALDADPAVAFGVLTGDVVKVAHLEIYDAFDEAMAVFTKPIHIAPGNHDIVPDDYAEQYPKRLNREQWEERYGPTYGAFEHEGDLFVRLDGALADWSITGDQLAFLEAELGAHPDARNVFVFAHHVLFLDAADPTRNVVPNSDFLQGESLNFRTVVEPLLRATGKPVFVFCGDIAATVKSTPSWYRREDNLHLVASGMGNPGKGSIVHVRVDAAGHATLEIESLHDGPEDLIVPLEQHPANQIGRGD